jgi:hypothetical protein
MCHLAWCDLVYWGVDPLVAGDGATLQAQASPVLLDLGWGGWRAVVGFVLDEED